ncbi:MAG: DUF2905 domain-containing protein [Chloroflexales bacterium]|nr:DUF2905 domain-containing protein [Chloroflexales bacterium]
MFGDIGRWLIVAGIVLLGIGVVFLALGRLPWLGRLPGDILIERENLRIFIPLGTMILLSLILTLVLNVIARFWR